MTKIATLEELVKKYLDANKSQGVPDSYDMYKHKNGISNTKSFSDAVSALYAASKRKLSSYGANSRNISNKSLQNSGYASYIDSLANNSFASGLNALKETYAENEAKTRGAYGSYLESFKNKTARLKKNVMSHLVSNDVTDLGTAIAYGISAGLSKDDAAIVGQSAYEVTKQKVFNQILEQAVNLGLDKEGTKKLALKMGISEEDAIGFADEIGDMLKYYKNISEDYLDFLEQRPQ